jgi:hypothetical protein
MNNNVEEILNKVNQIIDKWDFFEIDDQYENESNYSYALQLINKYNRQEVLIIYYNEPYYDDIDEENNIEEGFEICNIILQETNEYINVSYLIKGIDYHINQLKKRAYIDLSNYDYGKPEIIKRKVAEYLPFDKEQYVKFVKMMLKRDITYANNIIKEYLTEEYYNEIEYLLNATKFDLI